MTTPYTDRLETVKATGTFRTLTDLVIDCKYVEIGGRLLLNLSSNDYLGLQAMPELRREFLDDGGADIPFSSSSSRLLSGNDRVYREFEDLSHPRTKSPPPYSGIAASTPIAASSRSLGERTPSSSSTASSTPPLSKASSSQAAVSPVSGITMSKTSKPSCAVSPANTSTSG